MLNEILKNQNVIGPLGELIACYHIPGSKRTITWSHTFFNIAKSRGAISSQQYDFMIKNYRSFDLIRLRKNILEVFEVKTRKTYEKKLGWLWSKEKITENSLNAYREAETLGIITKLVIVRFHPNWKYSLEVTDFDKVNFWVDRRRRPFHSRRV